MTKYLVRIAFLTAAGIGLAQGSALAQGQAAGGISPEALIAARQGGYDLMQGNVAAMKQAVQEKLDLKPYETGAEAIVRWSKTIPLLFPPGTEHGGKTRALPAVWSDRAGFEKAAARLTEEATKLAAAAKADDKAAFLAAFQATGEACGACHRTFRAR